MLLTHLLNRFECKHKESLSWFTVSRPISITQGNCNMRIRNKSFEICKYQNFINKIPQGHCIHGEIKSLLHSENVCQNPVLQILPSHLLSENINIQTYKL
jgi:hypothetical protein